MEPDSNGTVTETLFVIAVIAIICSVILLPVYFLIGLLKKALPINGSLATTILVVAAYIVGGELEYNRYQKKRSL